MDAPETSQLGSQGRKKTALIIVGIAIITLIGALILGFYFLRNKTAGPSPAAPATTPAMEEEVPASETPAAVTETEETGSQAAAAGAAIDFDYELNRMDAQADSVNSDDFKDNELSDSEIGL
ncbi:MAG: hypothetical protein NT136_02555 [Candidatus Moranbacteria bacterium]|nr:hypothetical protein [Candidatus Moranbacteria bacterium]